ncbi:MAG: N-acetylgalactosamine-6-sulfatase [Verrucomicrobia bacterium]|nr:N-acetylgalactosamine-6-sulfatase [Verrucomicrobiota bacterium]
MSPIKTPKSSPRWPSNWWRINSYLDNRAENNRRGNAQWLDLKAPTLARTLKEVGYATGHFGKWHLGGQRDVDDAPAITAYGYDASLTNFEGMGPKLLPLTLKPGDKEPKKIWADAERLGGPVTWMNRTEITTGYADAALKFIDQAAAKQQPFYVDLWPDDVHSPYFPPLEKWSPEKHQIYLAVLEEMDRQLGRLFERIRADATLRDNTIFLICSDNGPEPGAGSAGPLRGNKSQLYEGGIRSSLVVWAPGLMEKAKVGTLDAASVFAAMDLAPSLAHLAGTKSPVGLDGANLSSTLLGRAPASHPGPIFWRRPPEKKTWLPALPDLQSDLAIRDGNWKLLCEYDGTKPFLYDLIRDAGETHNLASNEPAVAQRLTAAVLAWHQSLPADNGPQLGVQSAKRGAKKK